MALYAEVLRYRELFLTLLRRDLRAKYRGSALGVMWSLINPLVLMGVYTLVFSLLWKAVNIPHYPVFLLCGLLTWVFFQASLQMASTSLLAHGNLIKQVRFPRQLLPLSAVATNFVTFLIMLAVLIPLDMALIPETRKTVWVALPMVVPLVALVSALAVIVACLTVLYRDVEHLLVVVLLPWFFLTPVFYALSDLPGALGDYEWLADLIHWANFIVPPLEAIRDPLFFGRLPNPGDVFYSFAVAAVAVDLAGTVLERVDDRLAAEL